MTYLAAYLSALIVFGIIDAAWLSTMGNIIYRPLLGDLLAPTVRMAPAVAFYLAYPAGLVVFVVLPALREGTLSGTLLYGAMFGAVAYATYDLTNQATLRTWPVQLTLIDIAYGAVASGLAAMLAVVAARWLANFNA